MIQPPLTHSFVVLFAILLIFLACVRIARWLAIEAEFKWHIIVALVWFCLTFATIAAVVIHYSAK